MTMKFTDYSLTCQSNKADYNEFWNGFRDYINEHVGDLRESPRMTHPGHMGDSGTPVDEAIMNVGLGKMAEINRDVRSGGAPIEHQLWIADAIVEALKQARHAKTAAEAWEAYHAGVNIINTAMDKSMNAAP
jgi:hypothetical protein